MKAICATVAIVIAASFCFSTPASAADPFDHNYACLSSLYSKYLKNDKVNYSALAVHEKGLDSCVKTISKAKKKEYQSFTLDQKRAYWINAYNIFLLKIVVENYPIKGGVKYSKFPANSPMSINGAWTDFKFKSPEGKVTLSRIENNILPSLGEPLFIFGICNGTKGAAALSPDVYTAQNLEQQLDKAARRFIADKSNVSLSPTGACVLVTSYLKNHASLFSTGYFKPGQYKNREKREIILMNLLAKYDRGELAKIVRSNEFSFTWTEMDWSLNDIL
jgi:Protein of unknown function, DUF547